MVESSAPSPPGALAAFVRVVLRPRFWAARLRNLLHPGVLVLIGLAVAAAFLTPSGRGWSGLAVQAALMAGVSLLLLPVLGHAWAPRISRELAEELRIALPDRDAPGLFTFVWWWLRVTPVLLLYAPAFWMPPIAALAWIIAVSMVGAWMGAGMAIRYGLSGLGPPEEVERAMARTGAGLRFKLLILSGLLTVALTWATSLLLAQFWRPIELSPRIFDQLPQMLGRNLLWSFAVGIPVAAIVMALWAALSLHALGMPQSVERGTAIPQPPALRRSIAASAKLPWKWIALATVAGAAVWGYFNWMLVVQKGLELSHSQAFFFATANAPPDQRLQTAQVYFACIGDTAKVELLRKLGIGKVGWAEAFQCAAREGRIATMQYLLDHGADPNATHFNDRFPDHSLAVPYVPETALQAAAFREQAEAIAFLLRAGADPNLVSPRTGTALHVAAHRRNYATVAQLLAGGAKGDVADAEPAIFAWARSSRSRTPAEWKSDLAAAEAAGLQVMLKDRWGHSLLHWAARVERFDLIHVLLERGLSPQDEDIYGAVPHMHLLLALEPPFARDWEKLRPALLALTTGEQNLVRQVRPPPAGAEPGPASTERVRRVRRSWRDWPEGWSAEALLQRDRVLAGVLAYPSR